MILITGIAHTGSSILVSLFDELGFSTGKEIFPDRYIEILRDERIQEMINKGQVPKWPRVIKHLGGFCYNLDYHVNRWNWKVKHVIVLVRDLETSVNRRLVKKTVNGKTFGISNKEWISYSEEQKKKLCREHLKDELGSLFFNLVPKDYSFFCMHYPRWVKDSNYAYRKLNTILNIEYDKFMKVYTKIIDPSKVGKY